MARHNSRGNFPLEYAEEFWIGDEFDDEYYDVGQEDDVWSPFEENFKLYVGNVPLEMPQAKIEMLFKKFGEPIEIYKCPKKDLSNITWCLIKYASYIEALQTIKGLNQKPPYYLIVKFARTEEEKHHLKMKAFAQPYETPYLSGIGRGARFQDYGYGYPYGPQRNRRGDLSLEDDLEPYKDATPTTLKLVMTPEGRRISIEPRDRRVNVIPSDKPISDFFHTPTKNNLEAVSSENDLLGPGIIMALPEGDGSVLGGPCNYCKKITTFVCINCDFPYCSATCQVEHWHDHKKLCFRLGKNLKKKVKSRDMGGGDGGFIEHQAESSTNHQKFNKRGDDKHLDGSTPCNTDGYQGQRTFKDETNFSDRKQYRNRHDERNGNFNNGNQDHKEGGLNSDCHSPRQNFDPNDQPECKLNDDESGRYRNNGFNHDILKQDFNRNDKEGNRNSHSNDNGKRISEQFFKVSQSGQNFNKDNQSEHRPRENFSQNRDSNSGGHRKDNFERRGAQFSRDGPSGQNFNKDTQRENRVRHNFNPDKDGHDQNGRDNFVRSGEQFSKDVFSGQNFNSNNQGENRTHQRRYNQGREGGGGGDERLGRGNFDGSNGKPHNNHNSGNDQDSRPFEKNITGQNKVEEDIWTEETNAAIGQPSVNDKQPTDGITHSNEEMKQRQEFPTTFTDVKIVIVNGAGDYWVQRRDHFKDIVKVYQELNKVIDNNQPIVPKIGMMCAALYENEWYRARVVSDTPQLLLHYIDYGNTEECLLKNLRNLPLSVTNTPDLATRVRILDGNSTKCLKKPDSILSIRKVGIAPDGVFVVEEKIDGNESLPVSSSCTNQEVQAIVANGHLQSSQEKPVGVTAERQEFFEVIVSEINGPGDFWVQRAQQAKDLIDFQIYLFKKAPECPNLQPEVGLLCMAPFQGGWYRAKVKALTPLLKIFYVDYGNTLEISHCELKSLPSKSSLADIPAMAVRVKLVEGTSQNYQNLTVDSKFYIKFVGLTSGDIAYVQMKEDDPETHPKDARTNVQQEIPPIPVTDESEDGSITVQVEGNNYENKNTTQHSQASHLPSQSPKASDPPIQTTQASDQPSQALHDSNTSCQPSKPMGLSNIIAKDETMLAEPAGNQESALVDTMQDLPKTFTQVKVVLTNSSSNYWVQRVDQETALNEILLGLFNQTLKSLSVKLEIGLMCVGYYENHWYRVRVKTLKPQLTVHFVDFGNTETTTSDQLRQLPESLFSEPDLAMRIQLAEGTSKQYQNKQENDLLTVKSVGKLKDGSILVHVEGEDYSTKVEKFVSNNSTEDAATSPYKSIELPTDFTEVYVTVANGPCDYWVQPKHCSETARNITCKLNKIVSDCSLVVPKIGLACSALFMGDWYRGLVTSLSPQLKVFYVDYGNTETCSVNDLRTLPDNLIDTPSLANRVRLVDGTPQEYHNLKEGKDISIKRVDIASDGVAFVHVNGVTYTDSQLSPALSVTLVEAAEGPATLTDKTEETPGLPGKVQV